MSVEVEKEWRYRKVKSEVASKSAFAFKINNKIKQQKKGEITYGHSVRNRYSREVIFKITGGAWSKKGIKNTIEYISKNYKLELIDSEGIKYNLKEEISNAHRRLQENTVMSPKHDPEKKLKLTQNIIFSASRLAEVGGVDMMSASIKALKEKYPNNYFVMAYHDDTDNPHVHVVLNINKDNGERIDIRKKDLRNIRENYCKNLIEYGYSVEATRKYGIKTKDYEELKRDNRNIYQVIDFGTESYRLDDRKSKNNYLMYKTANDKEVTIWGKELLDEIQNKNIRMGDHIKISKTGEANVKVPVFDNDGKTIIDWRQAKRNCWKIEKAIGLEHKLEPDSELNIKIKHHTNERKKVIKLDGLEQREKQYVHREKFEHEKKLEINPEYKREFEQKQKLEHEMKYKRKFSW